MAFIPSMVSAIRSSSPRPHTVTTIFPLCWLDSM
jgi:hypothetical protein